DNHTGAALYPVELSCGEASGESTARGASDERSTASTVLSHPGRPSLSSRARPMPRVWPAVSPRAMSPTVPITWERSSSYCTVYWLGSSLARATIIGVFLPSAADREAAAAGYCADAPGRRSAVPELPPVPRP